MSKLKSCVHMGSQCDVLRVTDTLGMKALLPQKLFATLHSLCGQKNSEAPIYSASHRSAGLRKDKAAAKGFKDEKRFPEFENKLDRPRPIDMHPGPPSTEPSSSSGRPLSPAPPPLCRL